MSAPNWVKAPSSLQVADSPFHAGITVDILRGDLRRSFEQSGVDLQSFHHSTSYSKHEFSAASTYEDITPTFGAVPFLMRRKEDGSWRDLKFTVTANVSTSTKAVNLRIYALSMYVSTLAPDPTGGILDAPYAEIDLSTTASTIYSATLENIRDDDVGSLGDSMSWSTGTPTNRVDVCWIQAVATCTSTASLYVKGLRIKEIVE